MTTPAADQPRLIGTPFARPSPARQPRASRPPHATTAPLLQPASPSQRRPPRSARQSWRETAATGLWQPPSWRGQAPALVALARRRCRSWRCWPAGRGAGLRQLRQRLTSALGLRIGPRSCSEQLVLARARAPAWRGWPLSRCRCNDTWLQGRGLCQRRRAREAPPSSSPSPTPRPCLQRGPQRGARMGRPRPKALASSRAARADCPGAGEVGPARSSCRGCAARPRTAPSRSPPAHARQQPLRDLIGDVHVVEDARADAEAIDLHHLVLICVAFSCVLALGGPTCSCGRRGAPLLSLGTWQCAACEVAMRCARAHSMLCQSQNPQRRARPADGRGGQNATHVEQSGQATEAVAIESSHGMSHSGDTKGRGKARPAAFAACLTRLAASAASRLRPGRRWLDPASQSGSYFTVRTLPTAPLASRLRTASQPPLLLVGIVGCMTWCWARAERQQAALCGQHCLNNLLQCESMLPPPERAAAPWLQASLCVTYHRRDTAPVSQRSMLACAALCSLPSVRCSAAVHGKRFGVHCVGA